MKTAALLLAAGASSRFGSPKQLAVYRGKTLLEWAIEHATKAGCFPVLVVTGKYASETEPIARKMGADTLHNPSWNWKRGMQLSVFYGLNELLDAPDWESTFLLPIDLPWFTETHYLDFIEAKSLAQKQNYAIKQQDVQVVIDYPEGPGTPALLSRKFVDEADKLQLRKSLTKHPDLILLPPGLHTKDVDYPADLPAD